MKNVLSFLRFSLMTCVFFTTAMSFGGNAEAQTYTLSGAVTTCSGNNSCSSAPPSSNGWIEMASDSRGFGAGSGVRGGTLWCPVPSDGHEIVDFDGSLTYGRTNPTGISSFGVSDPGTCYYDSMCPSAGSGSLFLPTTSATCVNGCGVSGADVMGEDGDGLWGPYHYTGESCSGGGDGSGGDGDGDGDDDDGGDDDDTGNPGDGDGDGDGPGQGDGGSGGDGGGGDGGNDGGYDDGGDGDGGSDGDGDGGSGDDGDGGSGDDGDGGGGDDDDGDQPGDGDDGSPGDGGGPGGGGGDGGDGSEDGDGDCEGDDCGQCTGDDCDDGECTGDDCGTADGGGDCAGPPSCDGDEIQCAILQQQWLQRCPAGNIPGLEGISYSLDIEQRTAQAVQEYQEKFDEIKGNFEDLIGAHFSGSGGGIHSNVENIKGAQVEIGPFARIDFFDAIRNLIFFGFVLAAFIIIMRKS